MASIDLVYRARDYLRTRGISCYTKRLDSFVGKEGNVLRPVEFIITEEYYNGEYEGEYIFQAFCRSRSEEEAATQAGEIADELEGVVLTTANGSFIMDSGGIEIYAEPQELVLDEADMYCWEARFLAHVQKG